MMKQVVRTFFSHAAQISRQEILSMISEKKEIPLNIIKQMSASESQQYLRIVEKQIKEEGEEFPSDKKNIQNLTSAKFGPAAAASRAYAPIGFHS